MIILEIRDKKLDIMYKEVFIEKNKFKLLYIVEYVMKRIKILPIYLANIELFVNFVLIKMLTDVLNVIYQ
jgi:hypothetical protein